MTRLRVAIRVPVGRPLPELAAFVARCEDAGFDGVGIHDHPSSGRDVHLAPQDLAAPRRGFHFACDLADQTAMNDFRGPMLAPGPEARTDDEIDAWIRATVISVNHPLGTRAMGSRSDSVLDPDLKVRGIDGPRVVDASALPDVPSAHINAIVMMFAERGSDLIRGRAPLVPANV